MTKKQTYPLPVKRGFYVRGGRIIEVVYSSSQKKQRTLVTEVETKNKLYLWPTQLFTNREKAEAELAYYMKRREDNEQTSAAG